MEKFIRRLNIERFLRLLKNNPADAEREVLNRLLAEEEAKPNTPPTPEASRAEDS
jgi:hypothetical protein